MFEIKNLLNFFDSAVATYWGITIYDLIPQFLKGIEITTVDTSIRVCFALVGLIYAFARLVTYVVMSRLNSRYRELEIQEKENENKIEFYEKFNKEFKIEK